MDPNYRAEPNDWLRVESRIGNPGNPTCTVARALLELRARVEALEAAQQQPQLDQSPAPPIGVKPQWLADWLADEERLGDLEAAIKRYEDRGIPVLLDWVVEASEIRDRRQQRRKDLGQQPDHIADASKMVDTGWQNMADGSPILEPAPPKPNQEAQYEPILKGTRYESTAMPPAPPAPAEGLVELIRDELGHHGTASARAVIRKVAGWLRSELTGNRWLVGPSIAYRLEQEAER